MLSFTIFKLKSLGFVLSFLISILDIPDIFPALSIAWNAIVLIPSLFIVKLLLAPLTYVFSSSGTSAVSPVTSQ